MKEREVALLMKIISFFKKHWKSIIIKSVAFIFVSLFMCFTLNFLLVPKLLSTNIGSVMADASAQDDNVDILFLGSSRVYRSVDSPYLSNKLNKNILNLAYDESNFYASYHLLVELAKTKDIKELYLEVTTPNFYRETTREEVYIYQLLTGSNKSDYAKGLGLEYKDSKLFNFVNHIKNFSNGRFVQNVKSKLTKSVQIGDLIETINCEYMGRGYIKASQEIKNANNMVLPSSYFKNGVYWGEEAALDFQVEYFYKIIEFCEENSIRLNFFTSPFSYLITLQYIEEMDTFNEFVKSVAKERKIKFLDFSLTHKNIAVWEPEMYYDINHCNYKGATQLADLLTQICVEVEDGMFIEKTWFYGSYSEMALDYDLIEV